MNTISLALLRGRNKRRLPSIHWASKLYAKAEEAHLVHDVHEHIDRFLLGGPVQYRLGEEPDVYHLDTWRYTLTVRYAYPGWCTVVGFRVRNLTPAQR